MATWNCQKLPLSLNLNWKIARGSSKTRDNLVISYSEGSFEGLGEVAFTTAMGLSADETMDIFEDFHQTIPKNLNGLEEMMDVLYHADLPPNLRFGIESAYVHFLSRLMEDTPQRVLGLREVSSVKTSYSLPVMAADEVESFIRERDLTRFGALKIKVAGPADIPMVLAVSENYSGPLRIDGNEGFEKAKDVLEFLDALRDVNIDFIEQPLSHLDLPECILLKEQSLVPIVGDEAIQDGEIVPEFNKAYHAINVKLMKAGGYFKAMKQLREAKMHGLRTMIGCMIETSLGISSAMNLAQYGDIFDLDGFLFLQEDPYQLVFEDKGKLFYSHNH